MLRRLQVVEDQDWQLLTETSRTLTETTDVFRYLALWLGLVHRTVPEIQSVSAIAQNDGGYVSDMDASKRMPLPLLRADWVEVTTTFRSVDASGVLEFDSYQNVAALISEVRQEDVQSLSILRVDEIVSRESRTVSCAKASVMQKSLLR